MADLSFRLPGDQPLTIDDMGEGYLILSQNDDAGKLHRIAASGEQLIAALETLAPRYGFQKTQIAV